MPWWLILLLVIAVYLFMTRWTMRWLYKHDPDFLFMAFLWPVFLLPILAIHINWRLITEFIMGRKWLKRHNYKFKNNG